MSDRELGVGLIGCGDIAPAHARATAAAANVRLVACADVVESSARSLGEEFGVPYSADPDDVISRGDVDIVTVATPAFTHADIVERAAAAKKAVLCEKPLAPSLAEADRIIGACARAGVPLSTCFPLRYLPAARWVRSLLEEGALGDVIGVRLHSLQEKKDTYWTGGYSGRTRTDWRKSKSKSGGGVLITNLIHNIDLVRAMTGLEVAHVFGETGTFRTDVEVEDFGVGLVRYDNGAIGVIEGASCYLGGSGEWDLVLLGTMGQARFLFWGGRAEVYLAEAAAGLPAREWVQRSEEGNTLAAFYEDMAAAIRQGRTPPVTGEDGRRGLEVVLAIYQAAQTGARQSLPLSP